MNGLMTDNWFDDSLRSRRVEMTRSQHFRLNTEYCLDKTCGFLGVPLGVLNCGVISSSTTSLLVDSESVNSSRTV